MAAAHNGGGGDDPVTLEDMLQWAQLAAAEFVKARCLTENSLFGPQCLQHAGAMKHLSGVAHLAAHCVDATLRLQTQRDLRNRTIVLPAKVACGGGDSGSAVPSLAAQAAVAAVCAHISAMDAKSTHACNYIRLARAVYLGFTRAEVSRYRYSPGHIELDDYTLYSVFYATSDALAGSVEQRAHVALAGFLYGDEARAALQ